MLVDAAVLDLIHSIKLSLEENELAGSWRILIKEAFFKLFKGVHNLEEVAVVQEESEVLKSGLLYKRINKVKECFFNEAYR